MFIALLGLSTNQHLWALVQHELSAKLEKQIVLNKRDAILGHFRIFRR